MGVAPAELGSGSTETVSASVEREAKLGAPPSFRLPALHDVVTGGASRTGEPLVLDATYYDAPDLRLARAGITLRHRTEAGKAEWTLKLPAPADPKAVSLARLEVNHRDPGGAEGPPGAPPDALVEPVAARLRTAPLEAVVHIRTVRRWQALLDRDGSLAAEVVDDDVSVLEDERVTGRFREIEVELGSAADPALLDQIVALLVEAGAGEPDPTPKAVRALGPLATEPAELAARPLAADPSAAEVVLDGFRRAVKRLVDHDPIVREGTDIEGVHQARVATRRLRSDLLVCLPLLEERWVESTRSELGWLGRCLGEVRDADVLLIRLRRQLDQLDAADWPPALELLEHLRSQREGMVTALGEVLHSRRYLELLDCLVAAAEGDLPVTPLASEPARTLLPVLARVPFDSLARGVHRLGDSPEDAELHKLRIRAKRARYAAELAASVVGRPAQRLADRLGTLQDVLGEHQDACVARAWLRDAVSGEQSAMAAVALVAGQLMEIERVEAAAHREAWPAAWKAAKHKKLRAWMR